MGTFCEIGTIESLRPQTGCYTTAIQYQTDAGEIPQRDSDGWEQICFKDLRQELGWNKLFIDFLFDWSLWEKMLKPNPLSRARKMKMINFVHDINKFEKVCCRFEILALL